VEGERIILDWRVVGNHGGRWAERWEYTLALYGILHPDDDEFRYIGKADGCSVRSRWNAMDKHERVWRHIEFQRNLFEHRFIVAEFRIAEGRRLTRQLVCDVESFLIYHIKPWANTSNASSPGHYSRPDMVVYCQGHWPFRKKTFRCEWG
jgi:hypothetical protein